MKLVWHELFEGTGRVRALAWTRDCRAVAYELLQSGGQAFIRKTIRAGTDTGDQRDPPLAHREGTQGMARPAARRDAIDGPPLTQLRWPPGAPRATAGGSP
ncbi:hypothetical protein GCM10010116_28530 [Microbispora rosea subsp. aerata]|nr:hypothetical protein GCM10010116_28530 [Microbispora rosea subsp. aerata]GIH53874.1 hypothetical protein Mro02_07880 [Microbispora rosea subsp. aerata]GLJ84846.1 hypothetical protein GCM10017588_35740 [Microbispora rosea subsp. aerata]